MTEKIDFEASIAQLQTLENSLRSIGMQKQNMQLQLIEAENSLRELKGYKGKTFKIIGPVMVESDNGSIVKDLNEKMELLKVRVESFDKQEASLKKQFEETQNRVMENLKQSQENN